MKHNNAFMGILTQHLVKQISDYKDFLEMMETIKKAIENELNQEWNPTDCLGKKYSGLLKVIYFYLYEKYHII